jgi:hypothetical protein
MFLVCVHYFDPFEGIQWKMLDFVQEANEYAGSVHKCVKDSIQRSGLICVNISSFSRDNANVNFGKKKLVYQHLRNVSDAIVKGNCSAHIIQNCCKHASKILDIDFETVILKT